MLIDESILIGSIDGPSIRHSVGGAFALLSEQKNEATGS